MNRNLSAQCGLTKCETPRPCHVLKGKGTRGSHTGVGESHPVGVGPGDVPDAPHETAAAVGHGGARSAGGQPRPPLMDADGGPTGGDANTAAGGGGRAAGAPTPYGGEGRSLRRKLLGATHKRKKEQW